MANSPTQFIIQWLWFNEEYTSINGVLTSYACKIFFGMGLDSNPMYLTHLQMTGLDIERDQIIEMACIITDLDLNILAQVKHLHNCYKVGYSFHRHKDA